MYKRVENAADKEKNTQRNLRKSRPFWQDIDFLFIPYYNHNEILMENIGLAESPLVYKAAGNLPAIFCCKKLFSCPYRVRLCRAWRCALHLE